jgi:hypothetical protein
MKKTLPILFGAFLTVLVISQFQNTASAQTSEPIWRLQDTMKKMWTIAIPTDMSDFAEEWHPVDVSISEKTCENGCPIKLEQAWTELKKKFEEMKREFIGDDANNVGDKLKVSRIEIIPLTTSFDPARVKRWAYIFHYYDDNDAAKYAAVFKSRQGVEVIFAKKRN